MHSNNWSILKWAAWVGRRETMHLFRHLPIYCFCFTEKQLLIYAHLHKRKRLWRRCFCCKVAPGWALVYLQATRFSSHLLITLQLIRGPTPTGEALCPAISAETRWCSWSLGWKTTKQPQTNWVTSSPGCLLHHSHQHDWQKPNRGNAGTRSSIWERVWHKAGEPFTHHYFWEIQMRRLQTRSTQWYKSVLPLPFLFCIIPHKQNLILLSTQYSSITLESLQHHQYFLSEHTEKETQTVKYGNPCQEPKVSPVLAE